MELFVKSLREKKTHFEVCGVPTQLSVTFLAILNQGQVDLAPLEEQTLGKRLKTTLQYLKLIPVFAAF